MSDKEFGGELYFIHFCRMSIFKRVLFFFSFGGGTWCGCLFRCLVFRTSVWVWCFDAWLETAGRLQEEWRKEGWGGSCSS